tara:strand:- start:69 stop:386 length:318 start_codon:yes stop_codon:yes gene_type:complete
MKEPKICLCRDTMIKLFRHLQKTKSGKTLWQLIAKRTANQFPMRKPRRMKRPISPLALAMTDPTSRALGFGTRKKPLKTMRKKPRTAKQKAATRKLVAFNKKRFR